MNGQLHWYVVDEISINICAVPVVTDAGWSGYLEGVLKIGVELGVQPMASLVHFRGSAPNSVQRGIAAKFVAKHKLPSISIALLTDSTLTRGAVTAFNWLLPTLRTRAFAPNDLNGAFGWLATLAKFDLGAAKSCVMRSWDQLPAKRAM